MHISEQTLKQVLLTSGVVTDAQFEAAKQEAQRSNRTIENVIIGKGDITEAYFAEIISDYFSVPVVNFNTTAVDDAALKLLPEAFSKTKNSLYFSATYIFSNKKII